MHVADKTTVDGGGSAPIKPGKAPNIQVSLASRRSSFAWPGPRDPLAKFMTCTIGSSGGRSSAFPGALQSIETPNKRKKEEKSRKEEGWMAPWIPVLSFCRGSPLPVPHLPLSTFDLRSPKMEG